MLESRLQSKCLDVCKKLGILAVKVDSTSSRGFPDLTCVLPNGVVIFVELKTPTGKTSALQDRMIGKLERNSANVYVIRSLSDFESVIAEHLN